MDLPPFQPLTAHEPARPRAKSQVRRRADTLDEFLRAFSVSFKARKDDNKRDEKAKGGLAWVLAGLSGPGWAWLSSVHDALCFGLTCVLYCFVLVCFVCPWQPAGCRLS